MSSTGWDSPIAARQARQLVRHGHFVVNGRKTNIPSFIVTSRREVRVKAESRTREYFKDFAMFSSNQTPAGLGERQRQRPGRQGVEPARPRPDEVPPFNEALIVEYYSR